MGFGFRDIPWEIIAAAFLHHPCDVGGEDEVSQTCGIWGDNQILQRSEIRNVISIDAVSGRERQFLLL